LAQGDIRSAGGSGFLPNGDLADSLRDMVTALWLAWLLAILPIVDMCSLSVVVVA
jgi:hypothetical protein